MSAILWVIVIMAPIVGGLFALALAAATPVYRYQDGQCGESV